MEYCVDCASPIEIGTTCSMCYGDPYHGTDGYYLQWIEDRMREEEEEMLLLEQDMQNYILL